MPHQVDEEDLAEVWVLVNELTGEAISAEAASLPLHS